MMLKFLGVAVLLLGAVQGSFASSVYSVCTAVSGPTACIFTGTGDITVTATGTITWNSDATGHIADFFSLTQGQNVFSVIPNGSQEIIHNLNVATEPVGTIFPAADFIDFPVGGLPALDINFIQKGIDGAAACSLPAAAGQQCTPEISPGNPGPFNFKNTTDPITGGLDTTAQFTFSGVTADGAAKFSDTFSVTFIGQSFQDVLATLASTGSVSHGYSSNELTIVNATTPEPGSMVLIGTGLIGLAAFLRRRTAK